MAVPTRWVTETSAGHSQWYVERFRTMAAEGADLVGEARLIDALVPRRARILDAGCGPGRHAGYLARQGHQVVGVDADPVLIAAAREDHPGPRWFVADLSELDLREWDLSEPDAREQDPNEPAFPQPEGAGAGPGEGEAARPALEPTAPADSASGRQASFDGILVAGNVMTFVAPGTEVAVLRRLATHLAPEAFIAVGFDTRRELALTEFDIAVTAAGLRIDHRFATWDLRAWHDDADFVVSILRAR